MAKAVVSYTDQVLATIDAILLAQEKELDYKPINLDRGSYVDGTISLGSFPIDLITGGGMPSGKWTSVIGKSGSGKSTILYHTMKNAMDENIPVIFYDHEAGSDPIYMRNIGIKLRGADGTKNKLFHYFQPDNGQSTYRHINRLLRALPDFTQVESGKRPKPGLVIVIDSLDAMVSEAFIDNDENNQRGVQAAMHGSGMRLIKGVLGRKNVSVLAANQLRLNPGVMFGTPEYEPGGQAVTYYPDLKFKITSVGKVWNERKRDMKYSNVATIKNKQFIPFRTITDKLFTAPVIAFGLGFERGYDGYAYLLLTDQIKKGKAGYYEVTLPGFEPNQKWGALMQMCCSEEFRVAVRGQITSGVAFDKYFDHEKIEPPGENLANAGVDDPNEDAGPRINVDEDGVVTEEMDPDGPIKMKPSNVRV